MTKFWSLVAQFFVLPLISVAIVLVLTLVVTRAIAQHNVAQKIAIKSDQGIDSLEKILIGGVEQWVQIRAVYFFLGRHDKVVTTEVAQQYFDALDAPRGKQIIWFEQSGHWPHFEEPLKYQEQLLAILRQPESATQ